MTKWWLKGICVQSSQPIQEREAMCALGPRALLTTTVASGGRFDMRAEISVSLGHGANTYKLGRCFFRSERCPCTKVHSTHVFVSEILPETNVSTYKVKRT